MADSAYVVKLLIVQILLLLPLFAWNNLIQDSLDKAFPTRRKHWRAMLVYAVIATLVAIALLSAIPFRLPGLTVDADPAEPPIY